MWASAESDFDVQSELARYEEMMRRNQSIFNLRLQTLENAEPSPSSELERINILNSEQAEYERMIGRIEEQGQERSWTQDRIADIQQNVDTVRCSAESLLRSTAGLASEAESLQATMREYQAQQASQDQLINRKKSQMEEELRKHSDLLGLEVVPTQSGIILTFTGLDRQNPAKKFSCELGLENRQYVMRKVYPAVADVDRLVESLNKNNDISGFVIVLRKRFLTTV